MEDMFAYANAMQPNNRPTIHPAPAVPSVGLGNRRGGSKQTRKPNRKHSRKGKHSKKQMQTKKRGARKTRRG
jgi:hypothetical protein